MIPSIVLLYLTYNAATSARRQASPHVHESIRVTGKHLFADLYGIEAALLRDEPTLMQVFRSALERSGFSILNQFSHHFPTGGQGVTGIFLLATSHATFHTFPERVYMAIDVFSCGAADPETVLCTLKDALSPQRVQSKIVERGDSQI